eukprot:2093581-Rhodomonas_salina.1
MHKLYSRKTDRQSSVCALPPLIARFLHTDAQAVQGEACRIRGVDLSPGPYPRPAASSKP